MGLLVYGKLYDLINGDLIIRQSEIPLSQSVRRLVLNTLNSPNKIPYYNIQGGFMILWSRPDTRQNYVISLWRPSIRIDRDGGWGDEGQGNNIGKPVPPKLDKFAPLPPSRFGQVGCKFYENMSKYAKNYFGLEITPLQRFSKKSSSLGSTIFL